MLARWFRSFALKHAVVAIATFLANGWTKHKDAIATFLAGLDDQFEAKTGWDVPDSWQEWYTRMVESIVGKVDVLAGTKDFWRRVLDVIQNLDDLKKRDALLDEIAQLNLAEAVTSQMSADLAAIYNQVKHGLAKRFISANIAQHPPVVVDEHGVTSQPLPSDEEIDDHIALAAAKAPLLHAGEPITPDLMNQLIAESKARKDSLSK